MSSRAKSCAVAVRRTLSNVVPPELKARKPSGNPPAVRTAPVAVAPPMMLARDHASSWDARDTSRVFTAKRRLIALSG
jgi:hypothetical protein